MAIGPGGRNFRRGAGLRGNAYFMERTGRLEAAEEGYRKIEERYRDGTHLDGFYIRQRQREGGEAWEARARAATTRLFPNGMRRVALSDLPATVPPGGPPEPGWWIEQLAAAQLRFGLRPGDNLLALNGWRVENFAQLLMVLTLDDGPRTTAIVRRAGSLATVTGDWPRASYARVKP